MAENLLVGSHKITTKEYSDGWDRAFRRYWLIVDKDFLNDATILKCRKIGDKYQKDSYYSPKGPFVNSKHILAIFDNEKDAELALKKIKK